MLSSVIHQRMEDLDPWFRKELGEWVSITADYDAVRVATEVDLSLFGQVLSDQASQSEENHSPTKGRDWEESRDWEREPGERPLFHLSPAPTLVRPIRSLTPRKGPTAWKGWVYGFLARGRAKSVEIRLRCIFLFGQLVGNRGCNESFYHFCVSLRWNISLQVTRSSRYHTFLKECPGVWEWVVAPNSAWSLSCE